MWLLGFDTSNYTTSVALYNSVTGEVRMKKKLLPVREQECGLRQSDAVFLHIKQLSALAQELFAGEPFKLDAIGVSSYPRNVQGSYMPCFLVGKMTAEVLSAAMGIPVYEFSHQQGHIAAALYSAGCMELFDGEFYAFHVSGGTTEALGVYATGDRMDIELLAKTLDLNAGQAIDRIGVMMGLSFPCGREVEQLALEWNEPIRVLVKLKDGDCCLSGLQNQCERLYREQGKPKEYVARFCLETVKETVSKMSGELLERHGKKPLVYAGGVMSNSIIRKALEERFDGKFAAPEFSADNSAGIAVLASLAHRGEPQ